MPALLISFHLLLAGVFMLAGFTKLRDLARTREDFTALGLPPRTVPVLSIGLPVLECTVGALMLFGSSAELGVALAIALLTIFTAVIGLNLWRGRRPACACFGALTHARIGVGTLLRNLGLMAVALLLLLAPQIHFANLNDLTPVAILTGAWIGLGILGLSGVGWVFQLWRQQGRLLVRLEQLEHDLRKAPPAPEPSLSTRPIDLVGRPAPSLRLRDVYGRPVDWHGSRSNPTVLLFLDEACQHCRPLLTRLRTQLPTAHLIVAYAEPPQRAIDFAPGITVVTADVPDAMNVLGVRGTPSAILIDANGSVAEPVAHGTAAVMQILDRFTKQLQEVQRELAPV
jgi:uncharacterized membrane protein YphA (DoxX/SURF4 family)